MLGTTVEVAPRPNSPQPIVEAMRPSVGRTIVAVAMLDAPPTSVAR
jgi:hypothetical protein